jgi:MFS transporter, DHA1 family, inner membrane transport protein
MKQLGQSLKPPSNRNIQRLTLHTAVGTLASTLSSVFSAVFLFRVGLAPGEVFFVFAAILGLRFVRPLVLVAAPVTGLRRAFILGAVLNALSCPAFAFIDGVGLALAMYALISALGQVFYYTCYHALFSTLGDADRMGSQVGGCQALSALAPLFGPGIGGILLTRFGPWAAFGTASLVTFVAILPILRVDEPLVTRMAPVGAYAAAKNAARLYFADGWIQVSLTTAWSIVTFQALGGRYDSFGATMSLAGLVGAVGGMVLGRLIDKGNARPAVWMNAATLTAGLILRSVTFGHAAAVVAVCVSTAMLSGLYLPSWMTPVYNQAKVSPCMLRFQVAAEAGWDIGGALAGSIAAAICFFQLPVEAAILLALPMVSVQALLLGRSYAIQSCRPTHHPIGRRTAVAAAACCHSLARGKLIESALLSGSRAAITMVDRVGDKQSGCRD